MFTKLRSINKISIGILAAALILQFYSLLRRYPDEPKCGRLVEPFNPFNVLINCDSAVFMKDADNPERLFDGTSDYQDRPASALINSVLTRLLRLVNFPEKFFPVRGISGETYNYSSTVYVLFILLNSTVLFIALLLIIKIFSNSELNKDKASKTRITFSLLAIATLSANELTKTFFWTPHSQMFNLLQPAMALYLIHCLRTIDTAQRFFKFNFLLLLFSFFYPSTALLAVILLFAPFKNLLFRVSIVLVSLIPYALYPFLVDSFGGDYRSNHIQKFREFIWVWDAFRNETLLNALARNLDLFLLTFPIIPTTFIAIISAAVVVVNRGFTLANFKKFVISPSFAFAITYFSYLYFLGFYSRRLTLGFVIFVELALLIYLFRKCPQKLERVIPILSTGVALLILISWFFTSGPLV